MSRRRSHQAEVESRHVQNGSWEPGGSTGGEGSIHKPLTNEAMTDQDIAYKAFLETKKHKEKLALKAKKAKTS